MEANGNEQDRPGLIDRAHQALVAMRFGDDDEALRALAATPATRSADTRALTLLLFETCSAMVAALGDGGAAPVKVEVFDDTGEEVPIDEADPPVRTAVRTLLAEVHGNPSDAREQVEIALANAEAGEVDSVLMQALRWTARLSTECLERGLPVPDWVAEAMAD